MKKKRNKMLSIIEAIIVMPALFRFSNYLISLIITEAQITKRNLVLMIILFFTAFIFVFSAWAVLLSIIFLYFVSLNFSYFSSLIIILIFNLLLCMIVMLVINTLKKTLFFPETKKILHNIFKNDC
ncbi:MAG: hypothetical protein ACD_46C00632G0001 [uncultured bacterium]|nr:MAG: hypothetical protein ACD_46C00632G0001 [uncultured bacterium]